MAVKGEKVGNTGWFCVSVLPFHTRGQKRYEKCTNLFSPSESRRGLRATPSQIAVLRFHLNDAMRRLCMSCVSLSYSRTPGERYSRIRPNQP